MICKPARVFESLRQSPSLQIFLAVGLLVTAVFAAENPSLSRPVRPWEFVSATGTRAAIFGNESGNFEAWVYPLKILRDFHLLFHVSGRVLPAESLARTITVRPESFSILYASDQFEIRETVLVPVHESGVVVLCEIETTQPVEIEAAFQRDFQLEWPAGLGGSYIEWDPKLHVFSMSEEQKKFAALVGSPTATLSQEEYFTNYSSSSQSSFLLGPTAKGKDTRLIVIAGSVNGPTDAEQTFRKLSNSYSDLWRDSEDYYRKYLDQTVSLELPDKKLEQAYDWARISVAQGIVNNPYLGTGLVAGYRTSGTYERPGFAWFFGRDALWTSLALDADGDFATTRTALDFLSHYQRADGKIPHEIAQTATLVRWFQDYPYAYASADATPLYLVVFNSYVAESGDSGFASQKWDSLWKAYQFLKSTYGPQGFPRNAGVGHGWVEGGPLLPVESELYQTALGAEALRSLGQLARLLGKEEIAHQLESEFAEQKARLNQAFWSKEKNTYAFALDSNGQRIDVATVLATVPMWFGLLDPDKAELMIDQLARPDHQADWGMRIISDQNPLYDPGGYHYGSVWPLFTGWASVGEYRYHRSFAAYSNLRANALLALDGALGHVTEVLSGDYYQSLSTSSPHQIWSAAMVVSPLLRGMLGLETDAAGHTLLFAPHVPPGWQSLAVRGIGLPNATIDIWYRRTDDDIILDVKRNGSGVCEFEFSPALSPRAEIVSAELNGRPTPVHVDRNVQDQHATVRFRVYGGPNTVHLRVKNDFGIAYNPDLPPLGERSRELRITSETWAPDSLTLNVDGIPSRSYDLLLRNAKQVSSVEGAELVKANNEVTGLRIQVPGNDNSSYASSGVVIHFSTSAVKN